MIAFCVGLVIGGILGMLCASLMVMAGRGEPKE